MTFLSAAELGAMSILTTFQPLDLKLWTQARPSAPLPPRIKDVFPIFQLINLLFNL